VGTNLDGPQDWAPGTISFVDAFVGARPWVSNLTDFGATWGEGGPLDLTADGWIASLESGHRATTILMDFGGGDTAPYPTGLWTLLYDGVGDIVINGGGTVVSEEPGRMVVDVPAGQGMLIDLLATDPSDPVRNLHFIMPGHEDTWQTQPFNPQFLAELAGYSTLRFMNWLDTNSSQQVQWADRPAPNVFLQDQYGVPIEYMIELANTVRADPWFSIPHRANDAYVREFAELVRDQLDAGLTPYVEWSNETWNGIYPQTQYAIDRGTALGLSTDEFQAGLFFHARRAGQVFDIWTDVFGDRAAFRGVLASQSANPWTGRQVLQYAADHGIEVDAYAIAPYFGIPELSQIDLPDGAESWTVDDVLDRSTQNMRTSTADAIAANRDLADEFGVHLVAYEGGQHLVAHPAHQNDQWLTDLLVAANRHPRMEAIYTEYLEQWEALGGEMFVNFINQSGFGRFGSWGIKEYIGQPESEAPKYRGVKAFMGLAPTGGTTFDGDPATTERITGHDPVSIGIAVSRARFEDDQADYAVLSRDDTFPDSLAGSALSADGPLLFTPSGSLAAATLTEMHRALAPGSTVYLLGGEVALSAAVSDVVEAAGFDVDRLAGPTRIKTALAVADEVRRVNGGGTTVAIARAYGTPDDETRGWADSITGGAWAAQDGVPIVVTPTDGLHPAVAAWLDEVDPSDTVLLGGAAAIAVVVESEIEARGHPARRAAGDNRAGTAAAIATQLIGAADAGPRSFVIVNGYEPTGWAFGLAAGGLAADAGTALLVVDRTTVPAETASLVGACGAPKVDLVVVGGTDRDADSVVGQLDAFDGSAC